MKTKLTLAIVIVIGLTITITSQFLSAIDAPHNEGNHVSCGSCHGQTVLLNSPFWTNSSDYDKICTGICHFAPPGSRYTDNYAPYAKTHMTRECRDCHDPHYQRQKNYKTTDPNNYYLAKGTITSCVYSGKDTETTKDISTFTYSTIAYKSGWEWNPPTNTKLVAKTGNYRGTILFPNVGKLGYNYPITAVDTVAKTITVNGDLTTECSNNYFSSTSFAVIYGQYIKDSILTDEATGTYRPVKFFDKTGTNSFADGDSTYNGVCEVCHTQTDHYRNKDYASSAPDQHHTIDIVGGADNTNCITCHPHTNEINGFAHGGGGGTNCVDCHGTTGSHPAHISTIECTVCHDNPPHVRPGAGYSFTYNDSTNTCSNISCHGCNNATWGTTITCTDCHSGSCGSLSSRADIKSQFNSNSHHIQGVTVTGNLCYQCHWEANNNGTINHTYHGGQSAPGSAVDLVIYGSGTRPTTYTLDTSAIQYTANGNRGQIKSLNTHCLSCHSTQNNSITPFGDSKTPKQYAWDGTSIDAKYSQTGITTWGKYGQDLDIPLINESFEGAGYEEFSQGAKGSGATLNPDSSLPVPLTGAGSQCLKSAVVQTGGKQAYATRDLGLEISKTLTSFYLYVENAQNFTPSGSYYKNIAILQDSGGTNNVIVFRLYYIGVNQLQLNLRIYNHGAMRDYYYPATDYISLNTWYKIDIKYDNINDAWEWWVNGVTQPDPTYNNTLTGTHYTGIQIWNFGFYGTSVGLDGTIYYDLISVVGHNPGGNFTPKDTQTKAYSAHGNATTNQGGWNLSETWPNTRNGSQIVACFDCHNSHGSTVSGTTTSYSSVTTNGGILKDTVGKGGYSMIYKPEAGGSTTNHNAYNAGAGLCFDCHLSATSGTTPWGYSSTFGATQAIMGYKDTLYFGSGTSASQQRFGYKSSNTQKGGHFGASSSLSGLPGHPPPNKTTINGLCTPCHDPHGVSTTDVGTCSNPSYVTKSTCQSGGGTWTVAQQYGVPLLKGTWLTSLYKEDSAPVNNVVGTIRTDRNREGVNYHIDQNTFGSNIIDNVIGIIEPDSKFAGLCLKCHPKNSLTDGVTTVGNWNWKSVDRIHESVKGWGANVKHNYPCSKCHTPHNSRLPRLMVTNCLDYSHKGRVENNPSPLISGSGAGQVEQDPGGWYPLCWSESKELGLCPDTRGSHQTYYMFGNGVGNFPGSYRALDDNTHIVTCHENNATDQSWNSKTPWP